MATNYYNDVADLYDDDYADIYRDANTIAIEQISKTLNKNNPAILDIATGTGNALSTLKKLYPEATLTANDISSNMLEVSKKKLGNTTHYINDDLKHIRHHISPQSQDLILCHFAMAFASSQWTIQQSLELLKPGGLLSIATTNKSNLSELHTKYFRTSSRILGISKQIQAAHIPNNNSHLINTLIPHHAQVLQQHEYKKTIRYRNVHDLRSYLIDSGWAATFMSNGYGVKSILVDIIESIYTRCSRLPFPLHATSDISIVLIQKKA